MGLFSFLKNMGKKPEENQDLKEVLNQAVTKTGLDIKDFKVDLKDGVATLSGTAASTKDLELARLIVGNYQGVEKVNDDNLKVAASAAQGTSTSSGKTDSSRPARMVTVRPGDTLSKLAKEYLGDARQYNLIFEANRPMLKDPDEIYPGQVLRIPEGQAPEARV